jgi:hypothetical protein
MLSYMQQQSTTKRCILHNEEIATENDLIEVHIEEMLPATVIEKVHLTNFDDE